MIDLNASLPEGDPILVEPSNHLFTELGNNTYDFKDLLSELIDNSVAARVEGQLLHVTLTLGMSASNPSSNWLTIEDDGCGIPAHTLGAAISPAAILSSNSLNEHGLGMKQAIAGLGQLRYLATRTEPEDCARVVETFQFGEVVPKLVATPWPRGTHIAISDLKQIVTTNAGIYVRDIVPYLGARYRRFLAPDAPKAAIVIRVVDQDNPDSNGDPMELNRWPVPRVQPTYYHPNTHLNTPVVDHREFKGNGWDAELVFGYSPDGHEWADLGLDEPNRFHPYGVTMTKQGLDVLLNDRVIMFHQFPELGIVGTRHNQYNSIRGEIILRSGFTTAITKNSIVADAHWEQCIGEIRTFLDAGGYVKSKTYPDALPEAVLRDRLAIWLKTNPLVKKKNVKTEYSVEGLGGKIDVLADGEAWELKRDDASGLDVYQLFAYLDMTDFKIGYLLAKGFKTTAEAARDHINSTHDVEITLSALEDYPINHPLSPQEMEDYL